MTEELKKEIVDKANWNVVESEIRIPDPMFGGFMSTAALAFSPKSMPGNGFMIPYMDDAGIIKALQEKMDENNQKRDFGVSVGTQKLKKDENGNYAGLLREMVALTRVVCKFGRKKGLLDENNKLIPQNTDMDNDEDFWDNDGDLPDFDDDDILFGDPKDVDTPMPMEAGDEAKTGPVQTKGDVNHGGADLSKAMKAVSNIKGTRTR